MTLVFCPAQYPVGIQQERITGVKIDWSFGELGSFDQAQRRRDRGYGLRVSVATKNQQWRVPRADNAAMARCGSKGATHRGHKRARPEDGAKTNIHSLHEPS